MLRALTPAAVCVLLAALPLSAGDTKKPARPSGSWAKTAGDFEVRFDFQADTLKCTLTGGGVTLTIDADFAVAKDGTVFGRISKVDKQGGNVGPNAGDLFSFKFKTKGDTLTISELGPESNADARQLIEGDYKKK
jgi:hypothetical protein